MSNQANCTFEKGHLSFFIFYFFEKKVQLIGDKKKSHVVGRRKKTAKN